MNDIKEPSSLLGPNGQPIDAMATAKAMFGGQELEYFVRPGIAQGTQIDLTRPIAAASGVLMSFEDKVQAGFAAQSQRIGMHDLVVQSLMREVVSLRARIVALESVENDGEMLT